MKNGLKLLSMLAIFLASYNLFSNSSTLPCGAVFCSEHKGESESKDEPLPPSAIRPKLRRESLDINYTAQKTDTLQKIWEKFGGESSLGRDAQGALQSIDKKGYFVKAGELLTLIRDKSREVVGFRKTLSDGRIVAVSRSESGDLLTKIKLPQVEETERHVTGTIVSSLSQAASHAGLPFDVVDDLVDLFAGRINFSRDIHPGDTFSVVFSEKRVNGKTTEVGKIKAALFTVKDKSFGVVGYAGSDGKLKYYDENGETQGNFFLRYPVQYTKISSVFSSARFHPILQITRRHPAVDFSAPSGTPVRTVADGVVEVAGWHGTAGNMIQVRHDSRYTTVYRHLSKVNVKKGEKISRGEVIGAVGSTGLSTGPHLCFSVFKNNEYIDPLGKDLPQVFDEKNKIPADILRVNLERLKKHQEVLVIAQSEIGGLKTKA